MYKVSGVDQYRCAVRARFGHDRCDRSPGRAQQFTNDTNDMAQPAAVATMETDKPEKKN